MNFGVWHGWQYWDQVSQESADKSVVLLGNVLTTCGQTGVGERFGWDFALYVDKSWHPSRPSRGDDESYQYAARGPGRLLGHVAVAAIGGELRRDQRSVASARMSKKLKHIRMREEIIGMHEADHIPRCQANAFVEGVIQTMIGLGDKADRFIATRNTKIHRIFYHPFALLSRDHRGEPRGRN